MIELNKLVEYVQKTNPTMTKDELVKKLNESYVSSFALYPYSTSEKGISA